MTSRGPYAASRDPKDIIHWTKIAFSNLGVILPYGVVVLEVGEGLPLGVLVQEEGEIPETPSFRTTLGERGYFFRVPFSMSLVSAASRYYPGVRTKTQGDLVLVPPSRDTSGGEFEWLIPLSLREIALAPEWLMDQFRVPGSPKRIQVQASSDTPRERAGGKVLEFPDEPGKESSE